MKTKNAFLTLVILFCASIGWTQAAPISQTIASINADAQKPGGPERILKSISASTHVPVATLSKEKANSGLSYGDLYMAHAIASASGKAFNDIVKLKKQGHTWEKIADDNNVNLDGKKVKNNATAKSTSAPKRTLPSSQPAESTSYRSGAMH